jgi:hypothetical protein
VRAAPNRKMAVDWRVSPWGAMAVVGNVPGTVATRSAAWMRGVKR